MSLCLSCFDLMKYVCGTRPHYQKVSTGNKLRNFNRPRWTLTQNQWRCVMKRTRSVESIIFLALAVALTIGIVSLPKVSQGDWMKGAVKFDDAGALIKPDPEVFREWVLVGTPVTPNDMNGGKASFPEFHNVYMDPKSWKHYKKTGEFRDGTVLIKELISVGSKKAASGNGYFMGEYIGLEATIKDSKRFPDEPGNWAYFSFSTPDHKSLKKTAEAAPTSACNACHQGNAAEDWVFSQYYPVLRAVKKSMMSK